MTTTTRRRASLAVALALIGGPLWAADLALPQGARQTVSGVTSPDSYRMPVGPWAEGATPMRRIEGRITRSAWRIEGQGVTTLQVLQPLRDQLLEQGYTVLFDCAERVCGGFDFRFGMEVLPAPEMYVNLSDYRYLAARGPEEKRFVSLLVSRSAAASFVQIIQTAPEGSAAARVDSRAPALRAAPVGPTGPLAEQLEAAGHVVLSDLTFATGSSDLGEGRFDSLAQLAEYLRANPGRRVVLVGHTDAVGSLEGNIALSKRRAGSVRARLVEGLGVPAGQVDADGVGYLSPLTTNLTAAGQEVNRRVEAVLLPE